MKIVCTGYGIIAPNTQNIEDFKFNLENGICSLQTFDQQGPKGESNILGLIQDGLEEFELDSRLKRLPRTAKLGIKSAKEALQSSKIDIKNKKVGLFFGISLGSLSEKAYQGSIHYAIEGNYRKISLLFGHYGNFHNITAAVGHSVGIKGITKTISTGCTSSLEAVESALLYLKSGKIDVAIVGGTDSPICQTLTYAFAKTKVLPLNQNLQDGAIPFQENSKGFAMSEASAAIVLEKEENALNRGAEIKGEVVDVISNNDGINIFSLDSSGVQMISLLKEITARRQPDYVNSQALGIQLNDQIEKKSSDLLFKHQIPYTSIKSMYGNPFGVTGMLQVISSLLSVQYNFIPPTIRTTKAGYEEMNIITETKYQEVNEVAITNHGHGGNNATSYVKKYSIK